MHCCTLYLFKSNELLWNLHFIHLCSFNNTCCVGLQHLRVTLHIIPPTTIIITITFIFEKRALASVDIKIQVRDSKRADRHVSVRYSGPARPRPWIHLPAGSHFTRNLAHPILPTGSSVISSRNEACSVGVGAKPCSVEDLQGRG